MEEKMVQVERERNELEEAQRSAEESRRVAEEVANIEKSKREVKASAITNVAVFFPTTVLIAYIVIMA